jgi:hypothetical protein
MRVMHLVYRKPGEKANVRYHDDSEPGAVERGPVGLGCFALLAMTKKNHING